MTQATPTGSPAMQLDISEVIVPFAEDLAVFQRRFEDAYEEANNARATIDKFVKAAEAADVEGKAISTEIREIYRNGGSTKDAVKLKAKQREAFENAEIMRSLEHDGKIALARAELKAHEAASSIKATRDTSLVALEAHLAERLAAVIPIDVWIYVHLVSYRAGRGLNPTYNARHDIDDPYDFALREFGRVMHLARSPLEGKSSITDLLPPLPSGFSGYGKSLLQTQQLRKEIEKLESLGEEVQ